jgi:hypothetical protein
MKDYSVVSLAITNPCGELMMHQNRLIYPGIIDVFFLHRAVRSDFQRFVNAYSCRFSAGFYRSRPFA